MADELTVRADVPSTAHPDILAKHSGTLDLENTAGPNVLNAGREALTAAYSFLGDVNDAEKALKAIGNSTQRMVKGKPANVVNADEFLDAVDAAYQRMAPVIDRRISDLQALHQHLEKQVSSALDTNERKTAEGLHMTTEIRQHVKALPEEKRLTFLMQHAGDVRTVGAILSGPHYLVGLTPDEQSRFRDHACLKLCPTEHKQVQAVVDVIDQVRAAGGHMLQRYTEIQKQRVGKAATVTNSLNKLKGAA